MEVIKIDISFREIEQRKTRVEKALNFDKGDRVPVQLGINPRYWLNELKVNYEEYRREPEVMLGSQIAAQKWLYENIKSDDVWNLVHADVCQFYTLPWILGCELGFDSYSPWIKSHPVKTPADLEKIAKTDVSDNAIVEKEVELVKEMERLSKRFQIKYADGKVTPVVEKILPNAGATAVITLAVDLRGEELYLDMKEDPQFVKDLMEVVVTKTIERIKYLHEAYGVSTEGCWLIDDSATIVSPEGYREFILPYNLKMKEYFKGKCTLHCDGAVDHLLEIIAKEVKPDIYWGFGYGQSRAKVRELMGGKIVLIGNVNPMKIATGKEQEVYDEAMDALKHFAPSGGYILMDGNNICPDSPKENVNALQKASIDYARQS